MSEITLSDVGWDAYRSRMPKPWPEPEAAGRIFFQDATRYGVISERGEIVGILRGSMRKNATYPADLPRVGDWVCLEFLQGEAKAVITKVLPRFAKISRKALGKKGEEQILAANVDRVFILEGLDGDFNISRLERYLTAISGGGAEAVIVLNKSDITKQAEEFLAKTKTALPKTPVVLISALNEQGLDGLRQYIQPGSTVAVIGSSGSGKSTLINALLGREAQKTAEVRLDDSRGRHTTTRRELFVLPGGGALIDTPGMRELQLWAESGAPVDAVFDAFFELAKNCRYNDCDHEKSQGCAIVEALSRGQIPMLRYKSFLKLKKESAFSESKHIARRRLDRKDNVKRRHRQIKQILKLKRARQFGRG